MEIKLHIMGKGVKRIKTTLYSDVVNDEEVVPQSLTTNRVPHSLPDGSLKHHTAMSITSDTPLISATPLISDEMLICCVIAEEGVVWSDGNLCATQTVVGVGIMSCRGNRGDIHHLRVKQGVERLIVSGLVWGINLKDAPTISTIELHDIKLTCVDVMEIT